MVWQGKIAFLTDGNPQLATLTGSMTGRVAKP